MYEQNRDVISAFRIPWPNIVRYLECCEILQFLYQFLRSMNTARKRFFPTAEPTHFLKKIKNQCSLHSLTCRDCLMTDLHESNERQIRVIARASARTKLVFANGNVEKSPSFCCTPYSEWPHTFGRVRTRCTCSIHCEKLKRVDVQLRSKIFFTSFSLEYS